MKNSIGGAGKMGGWVAWWSILGHALPAVMHVLSVYKMVINFVWNKNVLSKTCREVCKTSYFKSDTKSTWHVNQEILLQNTSPVFILTCGGPSSLGHLHAMTCSAPCCCWTPIVQVYFGRLMMCPLTCGGPSSFGHLHAMTCSAPCPSVT